MCSCVGMWDIRILYPSLVEDALQLLRRKTIQPILMKYANYMILSILVQIKTVYIRLYAYTTYIKLYYINFMKELLTKSEMDEAIENDVFALFYLSKTKCGVCKSLKPKIKMIADKYPKLNQYYINLDNDETIIGQYSLFTVPVVLVFVEGRETIREARYMSIEDIDSKIKRISEMLEN